MKGECNCCGYDTELKAVKNIIPEEESYYLCEICRSTLIGNLLFYPGGYENHPLLKSVAYIGNMILDEVRKK